MVLFKLIIGKWNVFNIDLLSNLVINHLIMICLKLFIVIMVGSLTSVTNNKNQQFVQWTVNDKNHIQNKLIPILKKYPPLTSRFHFQLLFLINCMNHSNVQEYIQTKKNKFDQQNKDFSLINNIPFYFNEWLAGFIEAKGSFSIQKMNKNYSFSIDQTHDKYLMNAILKFYNTNAKIQIKYSKNTNKDCIYVISFESINDITKVVQHCKPILQGYQFVQLCNFIQNNPKLNYLIK
uniref:Putative LAGLIDADG homing endonuclease n=1 Tax=Malassezia furfur TaxID=55194 RepID=A0A2I6QC02_MALFU|nr:putative LAGLIDADG homing endonuclease [Malassezia furfur]AUN27935.1 hypothetical protein [Malassezia furfur]UBU96572.1 putative LAGLIDADG homing endonuclease [Malassezia furfur]